MSDSCAGKETASSACSQNSDELTSHSLFFSSFFLPLCHAFSCLPSCASSDPLYPGKEKILAYMDAKSAEWEALGVRCSPDSSFPGDGWYRASRMVRCGKRGRKGREECWRTDAWLEWKGALSSSELMSPSFVFFPYSFLPLSLSLQPLKQGWVTESMDGQPVSTILGNFTQRDMGSFRIHTLPNYWLHLSSDHGVSSRLTPLGPHTTEARVDWIVDRDAVEGRDYHLDKMLPFWGKTSDQDWHLCEVSSLSLSASAIVVLALFPFFLSISAAADEAAPASSS